MNCPDIVHEARCDAKYQRESRGIYVFCPWTNVKGTAREDTADLIRTTVVGSGPRSHKGQDLERTRGGRSVALSEAPGGSVAPTRAPVSSSVAKRKQIGLIRAARRAETSRSQWSSASWCSPVSSPSIIYGRSADAPRARWAWWECSSGLESKWLCLFPIPLRSAYLSEIKSMQNIQKCTRYRRNAWKQLVTITISVLESRRRDRQTSFCKDGTKGEGTGSCYVLNNIDELFNKC